MSPHKPPTKERLHQLVDAMGRARTIVFADLVVDRFVTGHPRRISREAPVLILEQEEESVLPGCGGNAVANIRALGGTAIVFGAVGDDHQGPELLAELQRRGIDTRHVVVRRDWRTPSKTRILGGGITSIKQQIVRLDSGEPLESTEAEIESRLEAVCELLEAEPIPQPTIVLSDYGYGSVDPALSARLRQRLGPEALLVVDSRHRLASFRGLTAATPNQGEAEELCGRALDRDEDLLAAGRELLARLDASFLLVTRGSCGMALFQRDGSALLVPVHGTDQVADVTGAGDTVIGTLGLALAAGATPPEAAILANYAGGVVVLKLGTATLGASELRRAIDDDGELLRSVRWVEF